MPSNAKDNRSNETTMIQGSEVNIGYATLTNYQINEATVERTERRYALDLLRSNCSLAALLDSNERYDPPRCAETTRRGILQKMENWVLHDSRRDIQSRIFWLYGGAGAGKSALAQTIAERFKTNNLAASFFFFKADANRNDGDRLIPTLALQLLQSFPEILPFVEEKILANPDLFKKNRHSQMFELLVEPLKSLLAKETNGAQSNTESKLYPRLVVIDGLDECIGPDTQCDLLQTIARAIPELPYSLCFLITSRPESHITRIFEHDLKKVARYNLSDDSDADRDIQNFLEGAFANIHRTHPLRQHLPSQWPPPDSTSSIVERSSGHFIYASTVMRFIQSPRHRPDDRLQVVLGLEEPHEKDRPFAPLDLLYSLIFLEIQDPGQLEKIHCALGIMHLRRVNRRGIFGWWPTTSDRRVIEILLELRPGDLDLLFDPLLSLVTVDNDDIRTFHKSLFDYLLDSSRSEDLALDLGLAHEIAAYHVLGLKTQLSWDSAEFQLFVYHCQFARLDDALMAHLRSLACDPQITFTKPFSRSLGSSTRSSLLQSILYFLQVVGRQDFDSSGDCYRKYVEKKNQCLRLAVPWGQRLKCSISRLTVNRKSADFERILRPSLNRFFVLKDPQQKETDGFTGRVPIPCANTDVIEDIKREHEMFSSFVKAHHRHPNVVVSFLDVSRSELVHSCHFVIGTGRLPTWVTFVMLVTYTQFGERLSCSEFEGLIFHRHFIQRAIRSMVGEHRQWTQSELYNNVTRVLTAPLVSY